MVRCWHSFKMCVLVLLGLGYFKKRQNQNLREMNEFQPLLTDSARKFNGYVLEQSEEENAEKRSKLKVEILKAMPLIILVVVVIGLLCAYLQFKFDQVIYVANSKN